MLRKSPMLSPRRHKPFVSYCLGGKSSNLTNISYLIFYLVIDVRHSEEFLKKVLHQKRTHPLPKGILRRSPLDLRENPPRHGASNAQRGLATAASLCV